MKGILVIAHGSRAKETEDTLLAILEMVKNKLKDVYIEHSFMEFSPKTVQSSIDELVDKGITEIKVVPYFLFKGIHLKEDIPNMLEECAKKYPNVKITMGETLGVDERLADIIVERITL